MKKAGKTETRRIEVLFKEWIPKEKAKKILKRFGLSPQHPAGRFSGSITLNVIIPADEVEKWTKKLEKDYTIQAVRDWPWP